MFTKKSRHYILALSSHGSMRTLTTHYIDAGVVAKELTTKIFE